jgi:hypothetical protein
MTAYSNNASANSLIAPEEYAVGSAVQETLFPFRNAKFPYNAHNTRYWTLWS